MNIMSQTGTAQSEVTVNTANGLHLVPCSRIAELARSYPACEIHIRRAEATTTVDAKTIFDLMTLGALQGTQLILEARGDAADEVISKLVDLFESDFGLENRN